MSMSVFCYGLEFSLPGLQPDQAAELRLEGLEVAPNSGEPAIEFRIERRRDYWSLLAGETVIVFEQPWPLIQQVLLKRIQRDVMQNFLHLDFLRADAVLWRGQAVLLPGSKFSGKSWLARALVQQGAEPWCIGLSAVNVFGQLCAYPAPERPVQGVPVGAIFDLAYRPGQPRSVAPTSPGQATLELTLSLASAGDGMGEFLRRAGLLCSNNMPRYKGQRGEAEEAAAQILEHLTPFTDQLEAGTEHG